MANRLVEFLFGKPAPDNGAMQVSMDYGKDLQNYMDILPSQSYAEKLYNGDLTREQINQGIANGLNYGIPQIKAKQEELNIRVPQTQAEIELAKNGQFNHYPLITSIKNTPRQGGLFRDINSGFNENLNQRFNVSNLEPNRNKSLATRFGEGLGTTVRLLDNPLVRGAIAYGLSNRFGDKNPLEQGVLAAGLNMQNKMKDRVYRDSLIKTAQQSRMTDEDFALLSPELQQAELNNIADRINSYRGYIGDDIYGQMIQAQVLRDNAQYKNMLLQSNMQNNKALLEFKEQEAQRQARQDERDYNLDAQRVAQGWANVEANREKANQPKPLSDSQVEKINTAQETIETLKNIEKRYSNDKYKNAFGLKGAIRAEQAKSHPILYAPFDNEITLVRQDVEMLRQKYAKAMEGGRMSDSDRNFYQNVLMSQNLSYENFLEGVRRLRISEENSLQRRLNNYRSQGKNVDGFEDYNSNYSQPQNVSSGNNNLNRQIQKLRDAGYSEAQINEYLKVKGLR